MVAMSEVVRGLIAAGLHAKLVREERVATEGHAMRSMLPLPIVHAMVAHHDKRCQDLRAFDQRMSRICGVDDLNALVDELISFIRPTLCDRLREKCDPSSAAILKGYRAAKALRRDDYRAADR